jgi:chromosome segregation ATPase
MGVEQAYLDLLDSNLELRIKLKQEETITIRNKEKIRKLTNDLERCELYIKYLEKNLISREDEIDRLKAEYHSTLHNLKKCQDHLELKEEALVAQDIHILRLEDKVDQLKKRIREITDKKLSQINSSQMALPGLLTDICRALDRVERYIGGDRTINPANTLNGIRITITTVRGHMQNVANEALHYQGLLNTTNRRVNNLMNELTNTRNDCLQRTRLLTLAYNNEANDRRRWWQIAQERQTNGQE